jgi:hypothetical protein
MSDDAFATKTQKAQRSQNIPSASAALLRKPFIPEQSAGMRLSDL